jgi:hypothetical protein
MQKSRADLQNQLESYSLASKGLQVAKNWTSGASVLATVAGSALALATNANAGIIYSGHQNITVSSPAGAGPGSFAAFTVGGSPWHVRADNFAAGTIRNTATARLERMLAGETFMNASSSAINAKKLASGAIISAGQAFFGGAGGPDLRRKNNANLYGQFLNSSIGFVGIKFKVSGSDHFGWIRVHANIGPSNAVTTTVLDWAYNDVAGASITAGEGIAPEPSTMSMGILAAGAAGVLAWRRRRKQIAA